MEYPSLFIGTESKEQEKNAKHDSFGATIFPIIQVLHEPNAEVRSNLLTSRRLQTFGTKQDIYM